MSKKFLMVFIINFFAWKTLALDTIDLSGKWVLSSHKNQKSRIINFIPSKILKNKKGSPFFLAGTNFGDMTLWAAAVETLPNGDYLAFYISRKGIPDIEYTRILTYSDTKISLARDFSNEETACLQRVNTH